MAISLAAVAAGGVVHSTTFWVEPSHTFYDENRVLILQPHLVITGLTMIMGGAFHLTRDSTSTLIQPYKPHAFKRRQPS